MLGSDHEFPTLAYLLLGSSHGSAQSQLAMLVVSHGRERYCVGLRNLSNNIEPNMLKQISSQAKSIAQYRVPDGLPNLSYMKLLALLLDICFSG